MDTKSVSSVGTGGVAEAPPIRHPRSGPTGGSEAEKAQLPLAHSPQSDFEFLTEQAAIESIGQLKQTYARFTVDKDTHEISVEIIDSNSREVLRSIPNVELRKLAQNLRASNGFVLDSAV